MFIEKNDKANNTDYIEFQLCKACLSTSPKLLVKVDNISFNEESSIYIDFSEYEKFISIYGIYFNNCMHSNGNSGGALLNGKGQLIGITTFRTKDNQGNVNYGFIYSIPLKTIRKIISEG